MSPCEAFLIVNTNCICKFVGKSMKEMFHSFLPYGWFFFFDFAYDLVKNCCFSTFFWSDKTNIESLIGFKFLSAFLKNISFDDSIDTNIY